MRRFILLLANQKSNFFIDILRHFKYDVNFNLIGKWVCVLLIAFIISFACIAEKRFDEREIPHTVINLALVVMAASLIQIILLLLGIDILKPVFDYIRNFYDSI